MKKKTTFCSCAIIFATMLIAVAGFSFGSETAHAAAIVEAPGYDFVDMSLRTYTGENYGTGAINKGDAYKKAVNLVVEHGGRTVANGNVYYGDYVNLHLAVEQGENEVIPGTKKRRISWDTAGSVLLAALGRSGTISTGGQVGCGMMYIRRTTANQPLQEWKIFKVFSSRNLKSVNQYFTEEGNYEIAIFFETYEWGPLGILKINYLRHVLTYKFNLRRTDAKIALIDNEMEGNYIQKGFLSGSSDFSVSFNGNSFLQVTYDKKLPNGTVLATGAKVVDGQRFVNDNGIFHFYVRNEAFLLEEFIVHIDSTKPYGAFDNMRRITAIDSAEVEGFARMLWDVDGEWSLPSGAEYRFKPPNGIWSNWFGYSKGESMSAIGEYEFRIWKGVSSTNWTSENRYFITVVSMDAPSWNKDILEAKRFNNFITRWFEVEDFTNREFYCFKFESDAFDAAMTFELEQFVTVKNLMQLNHFNGHSRLAPGQVVAVGEYWEYFDRIKGKTEIYFNRVNLTHAMNPNARANTKLKTWDYGDGNIMKTFDPLLFDNTRYLNHDFIFASKHPTQASSIIIKAYGDSDENAINLDYNFNSHNGVAYIRVADLIRDYALLSGTYEITEVDCFGNEASYTVVLDLNAPIVSLRLDGVDIVAENNAVYEVDAARVLSFVDELDNYAVIKVNGKYYWQSELSNLVLDKSGVYNIAAYDRNMNIIEFIIVVDGDPFLQVEGLTEVNEVLTANQSVKIFVSPYITIYQICIDGEEVDLPLKQTIDGQYYFEILQSKNASQTVQIAAFGNISNGAEIAPLTKEFTILSLNENELSSYSIFCIQGSHGSISTFVDSAEVGEIVDVLVTPNAGYKLKGIKVNGIAQDGTSFVMPEHNVSITAEFEAETYLISVANQVNGTVEIAEFAKYGTQVTMIFMPNEGYLATPEIKINGSTISGSSFMMPAGDVAVEVFFNLIPATMRSITIAEVQNGRIFVENSPTAVMSGTEVKLIIIPNASYRFVAGSLTINGVKHDYSNFIMPNKDAVIYAEFEKIPAEARAVQSNNGSIAFTQNEYKSGDLVTLVITPEEGYRVKKGSLRINGQEWDSLNFIMPDSGVLVECEFERIPSGFFADTANLVIFIVIISLLGISVIAFVAVFIYKRRAR